jgi:hypothetical protein
MHRPDVVAWVLSVCTDLRLSQAKTLADLVGAALGRAPAGPTSAKHAIKRAWRFCANDRVVVSDAMAGVVRRLTERRRKALLVALDWVEVRSFHTLVAAAVLKGRAVPLLWASYPEWELAKSQNNLGEGLLLALKALLPGGLRVVVLADRGFGRAELARALRRLGLSYVIRVKPDVWVGHARYRGLLSDYPVTRGMARVLRGASYRREDPVELTVVVRWKPGLPERRDGPWFLITDLGGSAYRLTDLYAKRMTVEELFRDQKSLRNGFALRLTRVTKARRLDRLLVVLALAYILLTGLGLEARGRYRPGRWCSSNEPGQCSNFAVGRAMLDRMRIRPDRAFAAIVGANKRAAPKWG